MTDRLMAVTEVMERLALSRQGVYNVMNSGQLRSVRIGTRRLIRESDFEAYLESLPDSEGAAAV
jgi:excisionase family DNA binding protein